MTSALAYADVAAAWHHYLSVDNKGRGVVLIGHSQGSGMLNQLIKKEIDPNPAQRKLLVAAYLAGSRCGCPTARTSAVTSHTCRSAHPTPRPAARWRGRRSVRRAHRRPTRCSVAVRTGAGRRRVREPRQPRQPRRHAATRTSRRRGAHRSSRRSAPSRRRRPPGPRRAPSPRRSSPCRAS